MLVLRSYPAAQGPGFFRRFWLALAYEIEIFDRFARSQSLVRPIRTRFPKTPFRPPSARGRSGSGHSVAIPPGRHRYDFPQHAGQRPPRQMALARQWPAIGRMPEESPASLRQPLL